MSMPPPVYTSPSTNSSSQLSTSSKSSITESRRGRPNKWSASRQRKLARLYTYTILPRKDIPRVLKDDGDDWSPGKESTTKTLNTILDKEPRWLRPKDRQDMDKKISGLQECKTQRQLRRQWSPTSPEAFQSSQIQVSDAPSAKIGEASPEELQIIELQASDGIPSTDFSETPLQDLLAFAPVEPFRSYNNRPTSDHGLEDRNLPVPDQGFVFQDEPILPPAVFPEGSNFEAESLDCASRLPAVEDAVKERSLSSTYLSITSLKRRMSQYSSLYVKAIARIMKTYSISDSSAASTEGFAHPMSIRTEDASTINARTVRPSSSMLARTHRIPRLVLPDAILVLDRYIQKQGLCIPGFKSHDSKTCWCLEELDTNSQVWVCQSGLVNQEVFDPPYNLRYLNVEFCDIFGNGVLHMLVARGAEHAVVIDALEQGVDGNVKNTAGQSFLHLLPRRFLTRLASDWYALIGFLQRLNRFNVNFFDCDVFGRNFFHLLTRRARKIDTDALGVLSFLSVRLPASRDAFGWMATYDAKSYGVDFDRDCQSRTRKEGCAEAIYTDEPPNYESYHAESALSTVSRAAAIDNTSTASMSPNEDKDILKDVNALVFKHARLLETATKAIDLPSTEDSEGRNGLHCLAEAALDMDEGNLPAYISNKRKRGEPKPDSFSQRLTLRYEMAQKMIIAGVNVNSYDKNGNTVLMAFVTHLPDGEDDKTLAKIFHYLIRKGANVHRRNYWGETALHIAVRLGHKIATRVLLESGANVHARTSRGKGVLAVGEMYYFRAREDPGLYASIMACMALCIQYGAVAAPTLIQEWSVRGEGWV